MSLLTLNPLRLTMQYQIFIQNPTESHFTASVIGMPACVAQGTTEAEALDRAQVLLEEQLAKGKIVTVDISSAPKSTEPARKKGDFSTLPGAGVFKDDPTFDDFLERMAEFRTRSNAEVAE